MFPESLGKSFQNFGDLFKLAQDESFQKFFTNPKVQAAMQNQEFKKAVEEKNVFKLMANQEFSDLFKDPEVRFALEGMHKKFGKSS